MIITITKNKYRRKGVTGPPITGHQLAGQVRSLYTLNSYTNQHAEPGEPPRPPLKYPDVT